MDRQTKEEDYILLADDDVEDDLPMNVPPRPTGLSRYKSLYTVLLHCTVAASILLNLVLFLLLSRDGDKRPEAEAGAGVVSRRSYSGLPYNVSTVYQGDSAWSSTNESLADEYWESLDTSHVVVAISDAEATSMELALSTRFPWDASKGLYHVKAFHQTHCLRNLRRAYLDLYYGRQESVSYAHFMHCLNSIRQDVMCVADDTPMPSTDEKHKIGDGQTMQCRDWGELIRWTQAAERHSCFHMIDDYRPVPKTLEQFDACPPGSQYAEVAAGYFRQWGHHDPYEEEEED